MSLFKNLKSSAPPAPALTPAPVAAPPGSGLVPLTEEDVKRALPAHLRSSVTPHMVDTLNTISADPIIAQNIRDNFVSYSGVLREGKFKTEDYISAMAYVSYKLMGYSNDDAYARTFPQRYADLIAAGKDKKTISAYVSAYHKGKLVGLLLEQTMIPHWVVNQDMYQKALAVQYELMTTANSEKVRTEAANSILTHLKKPENIKGQLTLDVSESNGMKELKNAIAEMAKTQRDLIQQGAVRTVDVAASKLIDHEGAEDV